MGFRVYADTRRKTKGAYIMQNINKMRSHYKQLCWTCQKCTNELLCRFVRTLKHNKKQKVDNFGYIIECEDYVKDPPKQKPKVNIKKQKLKDKDKAQLLGISAQQYGNIKSYIKRYCKDKTLSVEDYYKKYYHKKGNK